MNMEQLSNYSQLNSLEMRFPGIRDMPLPKALRLVEEVTGTPCIDEYVHTTLEYPPEVPGEQLSNNMVDVRTYTKVSPRRRSASVGYALRSRTHDVFDTYRPRSTSENRYMPEPSIRTLYMHDTVRRKKSRKKFYEEYGDERGGALSAPIPDYLSPIEIIRDLKKRALYETKRLESSYQEMFQGSSRGQQTVIPQNYKSAVDSHEGSEMVENIERYTGGLDRNPCQDQGNNAQPRSANQETPGQERSTCRCRERYPPTPCSNQRSQTRNMQAQNASREQFLGQTNFDDFDQCDKQMPDMTQRRVLVPGNFEQTQNGGRARERKRRSSRCTRCGKDDISDEELLSAEIPCPKTLTKQQCALLKKKWLETVYTIAFGDRDSVKDSEVNIQGQPFRSSEQNSFHIEASKPPILSEALNRCMMTNTKPLGSSPQKYTTAASANAAQRDFVPYEQNQSQQTSRCRKHPSQPANTDQNFQPSGRPPCSSLYLVNDAPSKSICGQAKQSQDQKLKSPCACGRPPCPFRNSVNNDGLPQSICGQAKQPQSVCGQANQPQDQKLESSGRPPCAFRNSVNDVELPQSICGQAKQPQNICGQAKQPQDQKPESPCAFLNSVNKQDGPSISICGQAKQPQDQKSESSGRSPCEFLKSASSKNICGQAKQPQSICGQAKQPQSICGQSKQPQDQKPETSGSSPCSKTNVKEPSAVPSKDICGQQSKQPLNSDQMGEPRSSKTSNAKRSRSKLSTTSSKCQNQEQQKLAAPLMVIYNIHNFALRDNINTRQDCNYKLSQTGVPKERTDDVKTGDTKLIFSTKSKCEYNTTSNLEKEALEQFIDSDIPNTMNTVLCTFDTLRERIIKNIDEINTTLEKTNTPNMIPEEPQNKPCEALPADDKVDSGKALEWFDCGSKNQDANNNNVQVTNACEKLNLNEPIVQATMPRATVPKCPDFNLVEEIKKNLISQNLAQNISDEQINLILQHCSAGKNKAQSASKSDVSPINAEAQVINCPPATARNAPDEPQINKNVRKCSKFRKLPEENQDESTMPQAQKTSVTYEDFCSNSSPKDQSNEAGCKCQWQCPSTCTGKKVPLDSTLPIGSNPTNSTVRACDQFRGSTQGANVFFIENSVPTIDLKIICNQNPTVTVGGIEIKAVMDPKSVEPCSDAQVAANKPIIEEFECEETTDVGSKVVDKPAVEDEPKVGKETAVDDKPTVGDKPTVDDAAAVIDESTAGDKPTVDEAPAVIDESTAGDKPTVDEATAVIDESTAGDKPTVDEAPAVIDESTAGDKPTVDEAPAVIDESTAGDKPTVDEAPAVIDESTAGDKPTVGDAPAVIDESTAGDKPTSELVAETTVVVAAVVELSVDDQPTTDIQPKADDQPTTLDYSFAVDDNPVNVNEKPAVSDEPTVEGSGDAPKVNVEPTVDEANDSPKVDAPGGEVEHESQVDIIPQNAEIQALSWKAANTVQNDNEIEQAPVQNISSKTNQSNENILEEIKKVLNTQNLSQNINDDQINMILRFCHMGNFIENSAPDNKTDDTQNNAEEDECKDTPDVA